VKLFPSDLRRQGPEAWAFGAYVLHLWTVIGLALSNAMLGVLLLLAPFGLRRRRIEWSRFAPILLPVTCYAATLIAAIALSRNPWLSLPAARELLTVSTLLLGLALLDSEKRVRLAVDGVVVMGGLAAFWGLAQLLAGYGEILRRIRGPFSHYMTFAGVLLLADLVLIAQLVTGARGARRSVWRWVVLALVNLALVVSLTRSAWVALVFGLTVLLLLRAPRWLLAYVPAAVLLFVLAPAPVVSRVLSTVDLKDPANYDRLCMLEAGAHMIGQRPLFGQGPSMVKEIYPIYRHPTAPRQTVPHLHNTMLQLAAERGLLGLSAYLWLMFAALARSFQRYRSESESEGSAADLHLGVFVALLAFNFAGFFEANWIDVEVQRIVLFLMAVPFALPEARPSSIG
jgi:O-antigen ligase